jgi:AraC-like DNA-binding protein
MSGEFGFYHYLPITDSDMQRGLYMTGGGRGVIPVGQAYPPAEHPGMYQFSWHRGRELPEFQLILITDGRGSFESDPTGCLELNGDCLVVLYPGVWHRYRPDRSHGWTERWVSLHGELLHRLVHEGAMDERHAVFPLADSAFAVQTFDRVLGRLHENPASQTAAIRIGAMELLTLALDLYPEQVQNDERNALLRHHVNDALVSGALQIIWTQSHHSLSVDNLCSQLPTTRRTLERRFSNAIGHSILDEINLCRLSRAKRLLTKTGLPIKSVAFLAGFGSQERLRCLIVEKEGCSPSEYRMRIQSASDSASDSVASSSDSAGQGQRESIDASKRGIEETVNGESS